jgi:MurNAc alpha-1-phosphate uridylyltransferase
VINGDIWCDWDPALAPAIARQLIQQKKLAWLLLTDNPEHHPKGDFLLAGDATVSDATPDNTATASPRSDSDEEVPASSPLEPFTFTGIGIYQPSLFHGLSPDRPAKLAPLLRQAMAGCLVLGQHYNGNWTDVGTPQRLAQLDSRLGSA